MRYLAPYRNFGCEQRDTRKKIAHRFRRYRRVLRACEQQLQREQKARAHAESIAAEKDRALAAVCHDLRTPLDAIVAWSQLACSPSAPRSECAQAMSAIERNAHVQAAIIDDVLDLARSAGGKLRIHREPIDMNALVCDALRVVEHEATQKRIRVTCRPSAVPATFLGDADRMRRVLWNLLTNALKFTPTGGRVVVEVDVIDDADTDADATVEVRVSDTGCGIDRAFLPRVFDRFEQSEAAVNGKARHTRGAGLGLAIVRRLVELHGGAVRADSRGEGSGATFTVSLPTRTKVNERSDAEVLQQSGGV
jgi:signal transduction histidine kinase